MLLASPTLAQMPNGGDTAPNAPPSPITAPVAPAPAPTPASSPRLPGVDLHIGSASGPLNHPHIEDFHAIYGGEVTFDADQADGDFRPLGPEQATKRSLYTLSGHVRLHETDTTIQAGKIIFDGASQNALALNALLNQRVFTIRSAKLEGKSERGATPEDDSETLTATEADLTTVPPGEKADYHIHAQTITLDQTKRQGILKRQGVLRNATLYLFGTRLLTIPRLTFHLGTGGDAERKQVMLPTIGVSARYGTYLAFGNTLHVAHQPVQFRLLLPTRQSVEATVTSQQTLYAARVPMAPHTAPPIGPVTLLDRIRAFATAPIPVLPDGDPLRFHDFLPEPNPIRLFDTPSHGGLGLAEELSTHVAAQGRLRDDLYVSRLPEVNLRGQIPLTRPLPHLPTAMPRRSGPPCAIWSSTPTPRRRSANTASSRRTSTPVVSAHRWALAPTRF